MNADKETPSGPMPENPAQTMRAAMQEIGHHEQIETPESMDLTRPHIITVPKHRVTADLTDNHRKALEYMKPARRRGTAHLSELDSLIAWANRNKGETSALFANANMDKPSLTCIADYHGSGPADVASPTGDPNARHCAHRAIYNFPLSEEWKAWMAISGTPLDKDQMGEFIETRAFDVMDPTPPILANKLSGKNQEWENRLIETAQKIEGRYGQLPELLAISKRFQIYETADLTVKTNRDTGEQEIQFLNEHKGADGKPLNIPTLLIIAIPVFQGGAPYRMTVRFRYRKSGSAVKFIMSVYNPEKVFEAAYKEATDTASEATGLPLFMGTDELA